VLLLGRKDILTDVFTRASDRLAITEPIIVDRNAVQAALPRALVANHGLEIVPWKPVNDAIPLQMWTIFLESRRAAKPASTALMLTQGGPTDPSPPQFESGLEQNKPSPPSVRGRKGRRTAVKKKLALPTTVSLSSSSTPLSQSSVRRSTRNSNKEGYCPVKLAADPSKKRKICAVMIDEATGQTAPISIPVLQDWGIKCGVDPSDLTEDALLEAPAEQVFNDQSDA